MVFENQFPIAFVFVVHKFTVIDILPNDLILEGLGPDSVLWEKNRPLNLTVSI